MAGEAAERPQIGAWALVKRAALIVAGAAAFFASLVQIVEWAAPEWSPSGQLGKAFLGIGNAALAVLSFGIPVWIVLLGAALAMLVARVRRGFVIEMVTRTDDSDDPYSSLSFELQRGKPPAMFFKVDVSSSYLTRFRVLVRLKTFAGVGRFAHGPYSGQEEWQIPFHERFQGHFSMIDLLATAQGESLPTEGQPRVTWPAKPEMKLDVQVAHYDGKRRLLRVHRREYAIRWGQQDAPFEFWPEIAPRTFQESTWPAIWPESRVELQ